MENQNFAFNQPEINFSIQAVARAAALARKIRTSLVTRAAKEDRSPVTVADFAIQALVAAQLADRFPEDPLIAEENAAYLRTAEGSVMLEQVLHFVRSELPETTEEKIMEWIDRGAAERSHRYWVLDPIDGTKGFLRGGQYAVALALVENDQVRIGVLGCPELSGSNRNGDLNVGMLYAARRGSGAWSIPLEETLDLLQMGSAFSPVIVSPLSSPENARLLRSYEAGHTNVGKIDHLAGLLKIQANPQRLDSQAKYALLAEGSGEAILRLPPDENPNYKEKLWDIAAGAIIVEEAGGKVTDLDGKTLDYSTGRLLSNNRGILATNRSLHDIFLRGLEQIQA